MCFQMLRVSSEFLQHYHSQRPAHRFALIGTFLLAVPLTQCSPTVSWDKTEREARLESGGTAVHRIETGSPLQVIPDEKRAWVSNVLVPPSMLAPNAEPRSGGIVLLDLTTFTTTPVPQVPDANGIAVTPVSSSFATNSYSSTASATD